MPIAKSAYFGLILLAIVANVHALDCLSSSNTPIAWWAKIKLPQALKKNAHLYYDSNADKGGSKKFALQNVKVDDSQSALYYTLNQLNTINRTNVHIIAYNDDFPTGNTYSGNAHAKGVIAFDSVEKKGFYVMHSVPRYPDITDESVNINIPASGQIYAQNFMCISIDEATLGELIEGMEITRPNVFYDNAKQKPKYSKDNSSVHSLKIRMSEQEITLLTKSPKYEEYFYTAVVAPYFRVHLAVASWGRPVEAAQCDEKYTSVNINILKFDNNISWTVSQDHSKWAISNGNRKKVACFADINRMSSQKKRGGSAMCFENNSNLYYALLALVQNQDMCETTFLPLDE